MKLNEDVLLEIVEAVRIGLVEGKDVSELLRDIDVATDAPDTDGLVKTVSLSAGYKARKGRVA